MKDLEIFKRIGFIILIVLVFTPLTFLVTNTIVENYILSEKTTDCYLKYMPYKDENITQQQEMNECEKTNQEIIEKQETYKFTIIAIINLIVILILLIFQLKLDEVIYYSLFFGAGLNTITIVMRYGRMNSLIGVVLGIMLFILILVFINKVLKKK